jgi:hypothetical protein
VEGVTWEDGTGCLDSREVVLDGRPELMGSLVRHHGEVEDGGIDGAIRQLRTHELACSHASVSRSGAAVPLICARRPNFPHSDWNKDFHWV